MEGKILKNKSKDLDGNALGWRPRRGKASHRRVMSLLAAKTDHQNGAQSSAPRDVSPTSRAISAPESGNAAKFDAEQRNARSFNGGTSRHPTDFDSMPTTMSTTPCLSLLESIIPVEIMEIIVGNLDFRSLPKLLATSRRIRVNTYLCTPTKLLMFE